MPRNNQKPNTMIMVIMSNGSNDEFIVGMYCEVFTVGTSVLLLKKSRITGVILSEACCAIAEGTLLRRFSAAITILIL
jgi:hypothetical protein